MPSRLSAKKVRAKMAEKHITATMMVAQSRLSPSTVDRVINGRATGYNNYTAQSFADVLGCTVLELLEDEYVAPAISGAMSMAVENVIAEAVAEAVTVIVDEVATEATPQEVAKAVPEINVPIPPALDVSAYVANINADHQREIERLNKAHQEHVKDLRREKHVWCCVTLSLIAVLCAWLIWDLTHPTGGIIRSTLGG